MPKIFRRQDFKFEQRKSPVPEFSWHTSQRFWEVAGSKYLQFDIRSLDSGKFSYPYHFHRASEELFLIISGEATLRSPQGFAKLAQGDLVFFETGASGAHQLYNHGDIPCVYLDIRTTFHIDVCEYPDSGKINILPYSEIFEYSSKVDYYKGEGEVEKQWPKEIVRKSSAG